MSLSALMMPSLTAAQSIEVLNINSVSHGLSNGLQINNRKYLNQQSHDTNTTVVTAGTTFPLDIPDNDATGVSIEIDATGVFIGSVDSMAVQLGLQHPWMGDLHATLTAPNGIAQMVLFSRVGLQKDNTIGLGFRTDLNGTYIFDDQAPEDFWQVSLDNSSGAIPSGSYRTITAGFSNSFHGGCTTRLNGAFKDLTADQANGVWTLHISDNANNFVGQVLSANLAFNQNIDSIFASSFEVPQQAFGNLTFLPTSDVLGSCKKTQFDFSGNGLSDFVTSWNTINDMIGLEIFSNLGNGNTLALGLIELARLDINPVLASGGDFDGDGITDVVFRTDNEFGGFDFFIRRSSRPDDLLIRLRTLLNFDDMQIGDYDGDGLDDLAWFVAPDNVPGSVFFVILKSSDLQQQIFNVGQGVASDFKIAGGFDHTGDDIADITVFVDDQQGSGNQAVRVYNGTNGNLHLQSPGGIFIDSVNLLPGRFLGDAPVNGGHSGIGTYGFDIGGTTEYEFNVVNDANNTFFVLNEVFFGMDPTDTPLTGDYDGDGIDDYGVWRPNTDGFNNRFIIMPSDDPDNLIEFRPPGAQQTDLPLASIRVR